jgi:hypothetical protein
MGAAPLEDGLHVIDDVEQDIDHEALAAEDGAARAPLAPDGDLESLRDAFVEAFNARDLEAILAVVDEQVECPDIAGDGAEVLAEEVQAIWERAPEAFLTRGLLTDTPVAVAWRPDEEGRWTRVALVCLVADDGELTLVSVPDDADALDRAEVDDPSEEELDAWNDWAEWDRGESTIAPDPHRSRP